MVNSKSDRRGIEQARQLFDRGINFLQKNQLHLARARENSNKARENLDEARENLNAAFNNAQKINNEDGQHLQVDILNALGSSYFVPYDWKPAQAIETCNRSLSLAEELNYRHGQAIALTVKAKVPYLSKNERNFPLAIEYYKQAKSIFLKIGDLRGLLDTLYHLQDSYYYTSNYRQAFETNNERLNIAEQLILTGNQSISDGNEQTGNQQVLIGKELEANALFCLATNYRYLGEYPDAREYYEQCLTKADELNTQQAQSLQANSLAGLGDIDLIDGNLDDAINKYQQSLTIVSNIDDEKGQANLLQQLANIYLYYYRDSNLAWNYNEQSLEIKRNIGDQIGEGNSISFQGSIFLARRKYDEALSYFNQSLLIMKQVGNESGIANVVTDIGFAYYQLKKFLQAEQHLNEAIKLWEGIRENLGNRNEFKVSIFEQQARTYKILQAVLIAQNSKTKMEEALEVAERGRARAFVELLISRLSESKTEELMSDSPTIEQIQQIALAQNSTLVEYSIIDSQSLFIWVIQPTGEVAFRLVDLKQLQINNTLENLVRDIRNAIGVKGRIGKAETTTSSLERKRLPQSLQQLHRILIQPITELLPTEDTARIIFIPQGSLFLVPFPALQDDSGQYLIKKHTILTAPSIQVLGLTRRQQAIVNEAALQEVLVLGQSTFTPPLEPLPYAEQEAEAIADLFIKTQAITGSNGTKAQIIERMPRARFIHLATHGELDVERGMDSAIVLAPSDNNNVLLTAKEILKVKLNAELVVLSACDTGLGRLTGDGVIGLSRSFISAGAPSVIVSLWTIPDSETAELMTEFYRQFLQNSDKAQALRQAMLMTIEKHPHPKNWAAFTLIGEAA